MSGEQTVEPFTELVYAGEDIEALVKERFPEATFTDESDCVHEFRFGCTIPGITEDDFYPFALVKGFAGDCLGFELMLYGHTYACSPKELEIRRGLFEKVKGWVATADKMKAEQ